jgi:hypothetical protein
MQPVAGTTLLAAALLLQLVPALLCKCMLGRPKSLTDILHSQHSHSFAAYPYLTSVSL